MRVFVLKLIENESWVKAVKGKSISNNLAFFISLLEYVEIVV